MNVDLLLSRLEGVRHSSNGWCAYCPNPVHQRKKPSLYIRAEDDGRILMHCFRCSDTPAILGTLGLELADLFPERIKDTSPEGRRTAREAFKRGAWAAALGVLAREAYLVLLAACDVQTGVPLSVDDLERLALAHRRITQAKEVLA